MRSRSGIILILIVAFASLAAPASAVWLWDSYILADEAGTRGYDNSIALDANGHPHVLTRGSGQLLYMTDITGIWTQELLGSCNGSTSIDVDSTGAVYIAFKGSYEGQAGVVYMTNASGTWTAELVEANGYADYVTLKLDAANHAHIAYYDDADDDVSYATNATGTWVITDVDTVGDVGGYASMDLDSSGKAHISYYHDQSTLESDDGELKYATNSSGSWVTSVVDTTTHTGRFTSIACDSAGHAHISYYERATGSLHYATNASGSWATEEVSSDGSIGGYTSIAVDNADAAHIACYRYSFGTYSHQDLRYYTNASASWEEHVFAYTGNDGRYTGIAVAPDGLVHIVANGSDTYGLEYLTGKIDGSWSYRILDRRDLDEGIGASITLGLDDENMPHIAYGTDYYARSLDVTSQTIRKTYLTDGGNAGRYVDTRVTSAGATYVSYVNLMNDDVVLCNNTSGTWVYQTITGTGTSLSMDMGTTGALHLLCTLSDWGSFYLRYCSNITGAWTQTNQYLGSDYQLRPVGPTSVAADTSGTIHAAYINAGGQLKYAHNKTGALSVSTVTDTGSSYVNDDYKTRMVSIALDPGGNPRIAFYDKAAGQLKYAILTDSGWTSRTLDGGGNCVSLAFDNAGLARIAYYAQNTGDLRLAWDDGSQWTTATIVSDDDVGWMPSLVVDSNNQLCVAYRHTTDMTLDYAVGYFRNGPYAPTVDSASDLTTDSTPLWTWTANGGGNGTFRYKLDDDDLGSGATETTTLEYTPPSPLADGSHTLYVQERDTAGDWSLSGEYELTIDTVPPNAPVVTAPASPTTNTLPQWTWVSGGGNGTDTYHVSLDDPSFPASTIYHTHSYTPPSALAPGTHTVYVRELDEAGNMSQPGSAQVLVVTDGPTPQTWFEDNQQIVVESDGEFYALAFNYTTSAMLDSVNTTGGAALDIVLTEGQWIGVFIYDYTAGAYTTADYIYPSSGL